MVAIPAVASPSLWIPVDNSASALIRYTGPWSFGETRRESNNRRSAAGTSANEVSPVRWIDSKGSLSVDFTGYEASLIGGMSFKPTADFAFCTIDGVTVPLSSTGATGEKISEDRTPLCHITGLADGPHVLTFNVTDIGSAPSGGAFEGTNSEDRNRLWIDGLSYATSRWNLAARQAPSSSAPTSISGTIPSLPSAAPTSANSTNTGDSNDSGTSSKTAVRIGEIAGGIIGGALLVVFLRGVFFFVQRNDGTRTAVGRPASPTYESGWTLPKLGKAGGKGGDLKKGADVGGDKVKQAQKGANSPSDVPLSPMKEDDSKVQPETHTEHISQTAESEARIGAA